MPTDELRPNLFRIQLGRYQCHLWRTPELAMLVDTGEPDTAGQLVGELRSLGLAPRDLDLVVLTHFHDDHVGGAAALAEAGAPAIVAHEADAPVIRGDIAGPEPRFTDRERRLHEQVAAGLRPAAPVRVDRTVADGDVVAPGAVVVAVPGHTGGSLAVHLPDERILFTGDTAAHFNGAVLPGVFNLDAAQLAESLGRLAELDAEVACFGHGDPVVGGAGDGLRQAAVAAASAARQT